MKIEEIEKMLEEITPGEWAIGPRDEDNNFPVGSEGRDLSVCPIREDAQFIAAAPTIIRQLLAERSHLRKQAFEDAAAQLEELSMPEYHAQGMGCGLEDRCITDRYEAMRYGWDEAVDRIYSEVIDIMIAELRREAE